MTLKEIIHIIEEVALEQPGINQVVPNGILEINGLPDVRYGVFSWLQGEHTLRAGENIDTFDFTFYYCDRITGTEDKALPGTEDNTNENEVQSVGVLALTNILRSLEDYGIAYDEDLTFTPFTQRFSDYCGGVYVKATLYARPNDCESGLTEEDRYECLPLSLRGAIRTLESVSSPYYRTCVENDIYRLNGLPDVRYPVVGWQISRGAVSDRDTISYTFTLFGVDRLGEEVDVQSQQAKDIARIIKRLADLGYINTADNISLRTFTERFTDECGGVFADITINCPLMSKCAEFTGDYNRDYSDDFLIY